jgi:hypothetical protein
MGALQAKATRVDDDNIFALESSAIEGEAVRAKVRSVVFSAWGAADQIDETVHSGFRGAE